MLSMSHTTIGLREGPAIGSSLRRLGVEFFMQLSKYFTHNYIIYITNLSSLPTTLPIDNSVFQELCDQYCWIGVRVLSYRSYEWSSRAIA